MKKQTIIKVLLLITMISIVAFGDTSFAQSNIANEKMKMLTLSINFIFSVCSRIWIIFANLAGQFLSNSRVYGAVIGMDRFLRLCRNIVKNLANFMLGAVFIFYLFRALFFQEEIGAMLKNILLKILVAGICIQASWFIVAATLDISTIATAAVWSIPAQLINEDVNISEGITKTGKIWELIKSSESMGRDLEKKLEIELFPKEGGNRIKSEFVPINTSYTKENLIDSLVPNANSLAGPLIFLGVNILDAQKVDSIDITNPGKSLINVIISSWGTIIYTAAMILLTIVAFLRIIYLWAFIVLSPIIILLFCLKEVGGWKIKGIDKISKSLEDSKLSVKTFLNLAFKPVIITMGVSLALIFTVLMKSILAQQENTGLEIAPGNYISSTTLPTNSENNNQEQSIDFKSATLQITVKGIGKSFGDIILTIITLVFIRIIIKTTITNEIGIDVIDNFWKSATGILEKAAGNTPFIPIWGKNISYNSVFGDTGIVKRISNQGKEISRKIETAQGDRVDNLLGINSTIASPTEKDNLERSAQSQYQNEFIQTTRDVSNKGKEIGLYSSEWQRYFIQWLDNQYNTEIIARRRKEGTTGKSSEDKIKYLETFFNDKNNRIEYWRLFNGNTDKVPETFTELKNKRNFQ